jgi:hypothetical protein
MEGGKLTRKGARELEYVVKDWREEDGPRASTSAASPTKNTRRMSGRMQDLRGGDQSAARKERYEGTEM